MRNIKIKHLRRAIYDEPISRKTKKALLGKMMSKSKLKRLLDTVEIIQNKYPQSATILPYPFCPKCGCKETRTSGNMVDYPERWVQINCLRCKYLVCESDNSPFVHALEMKEFGYELH